MRNVSRGLVVSSLALALYACGGDDSAGGGGAIDDSDGGTRADSGDAGSTSPKDAASGDSSVPVPEFTVGGTITGLKGTGLALTLNNGANVAVSGNSFAFPTKLAKGQAYQVAVGAQPKSPAQTCTVQSGSGTIATVNVTNVAITCVDDMIPVNVAVSGLVAGTTLVLQNNGGDDLSATMSGTVAFPTSHLDGAAYAVTVKTQPTAPPQTCTVASPSGTISGTAPTIAVTCTKDWANTREITVTSDLAATATEHQVLVVLDASFTYAKAKANGDDLRFSSTSALTDSLPYYVESWNPGATSYVWVKVPTVPVGASTIVMHYGSATASAASSFATVFPNAQITASAGAGSFTASADLDVDWFELKAGDTMTLAATAVRVVRAKRIIIAGTVDGNGRGFAASLNSVGTGPGGGGASTNAGAGGGGYGGAGGLGGLDTGDSPGAGGAANGTETGLDIELGSSAGSTDNGLGGSGGGALILRGTFVSAPGTISLDGTAGADTSRCGGGGAGGALLALGGRLDFGAGTVTAKGGNGGVGTITANDSGGGGGGGRLKFFARSFFAAPATMSVAFGVGGPNGFEAKGQDGAVGTTYSTSAALAADVPSVHAAVGPEN